MKIVALQVENIKKLVAVEIRPDGNLVQITGKNGQGKTSVLDSIWWALAGATHIQAAPIRKDQKEARIRLDLGELKVTRTFRRGTDGAPTSSITVENDKGARFPSPQKMLDALLGELSFDPLGFARMEPREQFNALRRFAPDVDFEAIANADRGDRERRTELGRFARQERAAAQAIVTPADTPEEPVNESALVAELEAAGKNNAELEQRRANRERLVREAQRARVDAGEFNQQVIHLREEIMELERKATLALERADEIDKKLAAAGLLPDPADTAAIKARIAAARTVNDNVRKLTERMAHVTRALGLEQQVETLTASIEKRQGEKQAAIAAAKMPVEGLGFGEDAVLLHGLPFDQASDAEQLRVSVAVAAALNPKLRVIRVRDGSLLDEEGMRLLGELAEAADMQIWVEAVDSSGKVGFVLEDGHVASTPASREEAAA